ncbi:acetolactate synthase-1/2/3 large subunit [Paenibacillus sp. UNCCL117]|uniref:thiamine pyrophosphate-binding protein n=1 Tax=unclassified Paenibacillus TaxID=185978 RepID=UPI000887C4DF|nr:MULTISPECIES: thiamine pyrophosphate-binding protein [unclassified Paenibacillus]SDD82666.1 acetolactate synthase-1/2/3 large subunit [Paenibacillus sp. cl123]SFW55079.1 acetolactate synthase-1/2/3 large subunit [Paenibacillus sp. UNCCL117]
MPTVSRILAKHLSNWGVTHVFGIPGKPVTPLVLELDRADIGFVLSKHEEGAGLEAAGYALSSRTFGVAVGTAGPGGINMLTAAGQALYTGVPVLFLTGSPPIREIGKVLGQDSTMFGTDLVKMFEPVTKFSARVERGELLRAHLEHAVQQAWTGVRGPVHLCIPYDVLMEETEDFELALPDALPATIASNLDQVATLLAGAKRPLLLAGGGLHALDAYREIEAFARKWSIPVATTPGGKGVFRSDNPLYLGPYGLGGNALTEAYIGEGVDLLIVAGSQLSDLEIPSLQASHYPEHIIQFDQEIRFIGKSLPVPTTPVLGNIRSNLRALLAYADTSVPPRDLPIAFESGEPDNRTGLLGGKQVMEVLREVLPGDALMYGDAGSHSFYAIKYFDIRVPGTFYFEEVFATMGRAIGYAVGAKFGAPERTVVCLSGDGCMFMNGTEVSTAVNYDAPVLFLVANNGSIDMVDKGMARHLGKAVGTTYRVPLDGAKFGEAMGARGYRCTTADELRQAVLEALNANETCVIDMIMDPTEIPPTMKRG